MLVIIIPWCIAVIGFILWWSALAAIVLVVGALIAAYWILMGLVFIVVFSVHFSYHGFKALFGKQEVKEQETPEEPIIPVKAAPGPRDWTPKDIDE